LYYEYGIFTVIYLHLDHNDAKKIHDDKLKGNLIVLGQSGDSKGLNALADRLEGLGGGDCQTRIGQAFLVK